MDILLPQFDFDASRHHAFWNEVRAVLTGRARTLLSFNEVIRVARREGLVDRGAQDIPVNRVIGSEGRAKDFDASFLPLNPRLKERWARVEALMLRGVELPPIDVYRVGEIYFVKDGHNRVSVARRLGYETIRAYVTEVRTRAPLGPTVDARELLRAAEYVRFLDVTQLDRLRPAARVECSELGHYDVLYEQILGHRYSMCMDHGHEVPLADAVVSWYDSVYCPVMEVIDRYHLTEQFPRWSQADLYLAVTARWLELNRDAHAAGPEVAGISLLQEVAGRRHRPVLIGMVRRWVRQHLRHPIVLRSERKGR
jgi:hypothetical protein